MSFVPFQRPIAPWSEHGYWGRFTDAAGLPNVAGSSFQIAGVQAGDTAWADAEGVLYVCTDGTFGAAVWTAVGTGGGGGAPEANQPEWFDDFLAVNFRGDLFWNEIANGALGGVVVDATTEAEITPVRPGIIGAQTGTSAGGRGGVYLGRVSGSNAGRTFAWVNTDGTSFIEWLIRLDTLSGGGDDYFCVLGWNNNVGGGIAFDAVTWFLGSTGNWQAVARSSLAGTTFIDTGVAPTTDWTKLRIDWDPTSGADFSIGPSPGALVQAANIPTSDPNLPLSSTLRLGPLAKIQKSGGSSNRLMFIDYARFGMSFTTGR